MTPDRPPSEEDPDGEDLPEDASAHPEGSPTEDDPQPTDSSDPHGPKPDRGPFDIGGLLPPTGLGFTIPNDWLFNTGALPKFLANPLPNLSAGIDLAAMTGVTEAMRGIVGPLQSQFGESLRSALGIERMMSAWLEPFLQVLPGVIDLMRGVWPANLEGLDDHLDKYKTLMMDEGLPIAWVPRAETMKLVFEAESPAARRAIYGRRWRGILQDCERLVNRMNSVATAPYLRFAHAAIVALRAGHPEAGQALAATTLDTVVSTFIDQKSYYEWVSTQGRRIDPDDMSVRRFFVICQLWGIHQGFHARKGDRIPSTFNRHGAVHAVGPRQYSRLNAVLGVAHLTSALWAFDSTFGGRD